VSSPSVRSAPARGSASLNLFARVEIQVHLMMVARELWLRRSETSLPEITTGLNLLSKGDFNMFLEFRH
jgi:hypothetical protein